MMVARGWMESWVGRGEWALVWSQVVVVEVVGPESSSGQGK